MARQRVIEITISDPETVLLLRSYREFLAAGTEGTDVMHNVFYIVVSALVFAAVCGLQRT